MLGSLTVVGSVLVYLVAPESASRPLRGMRSFMIRNGLIIVMVVLLLLGSKLLGDGLALLLGYSVMILQTAPSAGRLARRLDEGRVGPFRGEATPPAVRAQAGQAQGNWAPL